MKVDWPRLGSILCIGIFLATTATQYYNLFLTIAWYLALCAEILFIVHFIYALYKQKEK